jgi:hypothetical protein
LCRYGSDKISLTMPYPDDDPLPFYSGAAQVESS